MGEPARFDSLNQKGENLTQETGDIGRSVSERARRVVLGTMKRSQRGVPEDEMHESLVLESGHPDFAIGGVEVDPEPRRAVRLVSDLRELLEEAAQVVKEAIVAFAEARAWPASWSGARCALLTGGDALAGLLEDLLPLFREIALGRRIHEGSLGMASRAVNEAAERHAQGSLRPRTVRDYVAACRGSPLP